MRIQHNITAMSAYRNYTNNASALAKNLEKLSSGYKINRAGDDAAGLAISEKMRAQITGLEVAQKNAKDGISLVQTAEGALTEVHSMLNRMYELAEQSANGTYADKVDREQLQKEISTLSKEIDRISQSANFNGIKLLDGSLSGGGSSSGGIETDGKLKNVDITPVLDGQDAATEKLASFKVDLSQLELTNGAASSTALAASTVKVGGQDMLANVTSVKIAASGTAKLTDLITASNVKSSVTIGGAKYDVAYADGVLTFTQQEGEGTELNASDIKVAIGAVGTGGTNNHGYTQSVELVQQGKAAGEKLYAQGTFTLANVADGYQLKIGDTTYTFAVGSESKFKGGANVVDMTDIKADDANLQKLAAERLSTAAAGNKNFHVTSDTNTAAVHLTEKDGGVDYSVNDLSGGDGDGTDGDATKTHWAGLVQEGKAKAPGADDAAAGAKKAAPLTLQIGDTAETFNKMTVDVAACDSTSIGIGGIDISTQKGASDAMAKIKDAINYVSDVRGGLGATQNRLEHTINNLSVMQENIQDAESTIRDVDVAKEMMDYTKNSILVQSAQAMLAQANQLPQGVLQLLQ